MTSRRSFFLLPLAIAWGRAAAAALPPADREIVARIEAWLQGVTTLRARFTQLAPDGRMSTGRVFLHRPGRLRFDYDPPSRVQLIATDWRLIFVDWAARQVNVLPLSQTPLAFLLDEKVQLSGELEVRRVQRRAGEIALEVVRAKEPDQGRVVMVFAEQPIELRRWAVTDPQGLTTTVLIEEPEYGVPLDPALFRFRDPQIFGWPEG
ncbi:MAG: outer membrane lipoprotein carrier protein LolA [Geminicoccaceae bacterium]|nr:outer membrane lipoprotein carrier protein LolA [Geminicoccaceae bacterium]